jgi:hypothetical protein
MPDMTIPRLLRCLGTLRRDRRGLAMLEFGLALPVVLAIGCYGVELSNLALMNMRVSQYALNLADSASRVGVLASGGVTQLREADINDVLQGARLQGASMNLGDNGRVTLSSLENTQQSYDTDYQQRIHWQRCFGMKSGADYESHYGSTPVAAASDGTQANQGTSAPTGMGDSGNKVNAPKDNAVMFVEINYLYKPLFGSMFVAPKVIHYTASLLVRDNRDYSQLYNTVTTPVTPRSTCDKYTA